MKQGVNHVQWCMDSCRWDSFIHANTPNMDNHADYRMVYSRAGLTAPSIYGVFMNLSWYQSNGDVPVPWMKRWIWIPRDIRNEGYYAVFISENPMMKLYRNNFDNFDEYICLEGCTYHADKIVDEVQRIYNEVDKPKYIFLLLMETHQPYPYRKGLSKKYYNENYRPITRQMKSLEHLDKDFGRMRRFLEGTNTDLLVFSDHGDLDLVLEGEQGHGPAKFHPKLFEIPLGRKTI